MDLVANPALVGMNDIRLIRAPKRQAARVGRLPLQEDVTQLRVDRNSKGLRVEAIPPRSKRSDGASGPSGWNAVCVRLCPSPNDVDLHGFPEGHFSLPVKV